MPRRYWLAKSEPFKYSFEQLVRDGRTHWDGVRNFEARNNLRAMAPGDLVLFYHSNEGLAVVGVARVAREAYPDPSAPGEDWSVVDLEPVAPLPEPVPLASIRTTPALASMAILRRSRLSVTPVTEAEFDEVLRLGGADARAVAKAAASARPTSTTPPTAPKATGKTAPAAKKVSAGKTAPAAKKPPAGKTAPAAKKVSAGKAAPVVEKAPAVAKAPARTKALAGENAPAAPRGAAKKAAPRGAAR